MKVTVVCVFVGVLAALVCDSSAQIGGPGLGWAIGQQASVNAVSLAIDGALAKSDPATLPPELQVNKTLIYMNFRMASNAILNHSFLFRLPVGRGQEELQKILEDAQLALAACDDLLTTSTVWRYKICKFQELSKIKARLFELKLKAAAAAAAAVPSEPESADGSAPAAQLA